MTIILKIRVDRVNHDGRIKEIFRQSLEYDESVTIPFNDLYVGLRLLFPCKDDVISFSVNK